MGEAADVMNALSCQWTSSEKGEEPQLVLTSLDVKTARLIVQVGALTGLTFATSCISPRS